MAAATASAGTILRMRLTAGGADPASTFLRKSVSTIPAQTLTNRIESLRNSRRSESWIESRANLLAEYPAAQGSATRPATEPMLTITPPPRCFITGITSWDSARGASTLTSSRRENNDMGVSLGCAYRPTPALFTRVSIPPYSSSVRANAVSRDCSLVTSPGMVRTSSPARRTRSESGRASTDTRHPAARNRRTQATPIPEEPPVIRTTRPRLPI